MTVTIEDVTGLDSRRYHYHCTHQHHVSNSPRPLDACPVYDRGEPCAGTLERYGPGSRRG